MKKLWRNYSIRKGFVVLTIGILLVALSFSFVSLFTITHIDVYPSTISMSIDPSQFPSNLLFFPTDRLRTFLLKEYPRIQDVQFKKVFPHTLQVQFTPRTPVAIITSGPKMLAIDDKGVVFDDPIQGLPVIEVQHVSLVEGTAVREPGVFAALDFLKEISPEEQIERVILDTNHTLNVTINSIQVLLSDSNGKEQADTLQILLKGFRMKGSLPHVIDLRFSKPIITP